VFAFESGCGIRPLIISKRGVALGVYQTKCVNQDGLRYDRLAGAGVAFWGGAFIVGYTDRASMRVDPTRGPVVFSTPELALGTLPRLEIMTGQSADQIAKDKYVLPFLLYQPNSLTIPEP